MLHNMETKAKDEQVRKAADVIVGGPGGVDTLVHDTVASIMRDFQPILDGIVADFEKS